MRFPSCCWHTLQWKAIKKMEQNWSFWSEGFSCGWPGARIPRKANFSFRDSTSFCWNVLKGNQLEVCSFGGGCTLVGSLPRHYADVHSQPTQNLPQQFQPFQVTTIYDAIYQPFPPSGWMNWNCCGTLRKLIFPGSTKNSNFSKLFSTHQRFKAIHHSNRALKFTEVAIWCSVLRKLLLRCA